MRIIHRYILREIFIPFALGLAVFTMILLIARILKLVELVVNRGVPLLDVLRLFSYILPAFLEVTVPMALLLGILVALGRLSSDSEITALKTSGISLYQMARPIALFAVFVFAGAMLLSVYARPWGNGLLRNGLYEIAKVRASAGIREKVFTNDFPGLVIYVDHIEPPGNTLHGILIADSRERNERNTVFAKLGVLVSNERAHALALRLYDGSIHAFQQEESSYQRTDFATYDISLDLNAALARLRPRHKDPNEVGLAELRARIANKRSDGLPAFAEEVELQRRFSIPFACLAFAVIAVPLGMRPSSAVRSRGFGISLALIFVYYLLLTLGESLGERGVLPAVVALWVPNVLLGALAVVLFARAAQDKFLSTPDFLLAWMARWRARLAALRSGRPQ